MYLQNLISSKFAFRVISASHSPFRLFSDFGNVSDFDGFLGPFLKKYQKTIFPIEDYVTNEIS